MWVVSLQKMELSTIEIGEGFSFISKSFIIVTLRRKR